MFVLEAGQAKEWNLPAEAERVAGPIVRSKPLSLGCRLEGFIDGLGTEGGERARLVNQRNTEERRQTTEMSCAFAWGGP